MLMCINACYLFWGGYVTKVTEDEFWSEMQVVELSHEPHGFVRGAFRHQNIPISQVVAQRLQGRSAYLGKFECMVGLRRRMNTWGDMLFRWSGPPVIETTGATMCAAQAIDGEGVGIQSKTATTRRNQEAAVAGDGAQTDNSFGTTAPIPDGANRVLYKGRTVIWIRADTELQLRRMIYAHMKEAGHRRWKYRWRG